MFLNAALTAATPLVSGYLLNKVKKYGAPLAAQHANSFAKHFGIPIHVSSTYSAKRKKVKSFAKAAAFINRKARKRKLKARRHY